MVDAKCSSLAMQTGAYLRRAVLVALLGGLAPQPGRAIVTWTTIGCAGATVQGQSLDSMWDNAALMAANAINTIETITGNSAIQALTTPGKLATNAKWMFGVDVSFGGILPSSSKDTLTGTVVPVYRNAKDLLGGSDPSKNGYIICGGESAQQGQVGSYANAWYYSIPGTQDVIVLSGQPTGERPCSPEVRPPTLGQTFNGKIYPAGADVTALPTGTAKAILFCTALLDSNGFKGILSSGFAATDPEEKFPDPDKYRSASGTLLHEMIHAIDTDKYQDQRDPDLFKDNFAAYGFNRCAALAKTSQSKALVNPDGYRIFAEMCMSSDTRWGAPKPPKAVTPPPSKKRSLVSRDAPRLSAAERRAAGPLLGPPMSDAGAMKMDYLADHLGWSS